MKSALATDLYQLTMMAGYHHAAISGRSTFELFVRDLPPRRAFLIAAGLQQALEFLENLRFTPEEIDYLRSVPALARAPSSFFADVLPEFRFRGDVWAVREGEPVFAREPILRLTATAAEAQLVETALLATITFQTSIASKAARVVFAARGRSTVEFGSRRAHGLEAALYAARAAFIAGCVGTSNVEAGYRFGIPLSGTMAHSWVMTFASEIDAFRAYLDLFGNETTLLIDTYDTVASARSIAAAGLEPASVRLDSGDLLELSKAVRHLMDDKGSRATRIFASGDLDEYKIAALLEGGAPIDAFGVGTALSTSNDAPALGGVYKLVAAERGGRMTPVVKLSQGKQTLGGAKQVWRVAKNRVAIEDWIGTDDEDGPAGGRPLLTQVMRNGLRVGAAIPLPELREKCLRAVQELPTSVRQVMDWTTYDVKITDRLQELTRVAERNAKGGPRPTE